MDGKGQRRRDEETGTERGVEEEKERKGKEGNVRWRGRVQGGEDRDSKQQISIDVSDLVIIYILIFWYHCMSKRFIIISLFSLYDSYVIFDGYRLIIVILRA